MNFRSQFAERAQQLRQVGADVPKTLRAVQTAATVAAVRVAQDKTPPNAENGISGTGTRTGNLKAHWASDSNIWSEQHGNEYTTTLANNMYYASYVNDGHDMSQHFVPGLMVNPKSGMLERVPPNIGGIVVGTKTSRVPGVYMNEAAIEEYKQVVIEQLDKALDALKK